MPPFCISFSTIIADKNTKNGIYSYRESAVYDSCYLSVEEGIYGYDYALEGGNSTIQGKTVGRAAAVGAEYSSELASQKNYVISGSLQADRDNMAGEYGTELNGTKADDEVYAAPINAEGTKLTRFDIHRSVNQEVGDAAGRRASDATIYGNSLRLAERRIAQAERSGYKFLGWFAHRYEIATCIFQYIRYT